MSDDVPTSGVFDCDTHIYEPRDAATRYLAEEFMDRSIRTIRNSKDHAWCSQARVSRTS